VYYDSSQQAFVYNSRWVYSFNKYIDWERIIQFDIEWRTSGSPNERYLHTIVFDYLKQIGLGVDGLWCMEALQFPVRIALTILLRNLS